jgi:hypothetical protein
VDRPLGAVDDEVVDQRPLAIEGLSADPDRAWHDVTVIELGDEPAQLTDEGTTADGSAELA